MTVNPRTRQTEAHEQRLGATWEGATGGEIGCPATDEAGLPRFCAGSRGALRLLDRASAAVMGQATGENPGTLAS